jgi:hypothetical protein
MGWTMNLPKVHTGSRITESVLNDWIFSGIFNAHTGRPYSVTINNDSALNSESNQRAALIPGVSPNLPKTRHRSAKVTEYFNVNAFTYPTIGTLSPVKRNSFYGPGYLNTNMTVGRYFPLTRVRQDMRLLFRAEAFNVWNTPNLANPKAQFSCSSTSIQTPGNQYFGLPCATPITTTTNGVTSNSTVGSLNNTFGVVQSTFGNNSNTSTNGRKMQFSVTVYF